MKFLAAYLITIRKHPSLHGLWTWRWWWRCLKWIISFADIGRLIINFAATLSYISINFQMQLPPFCSYFLVYFHLLFTYLLFSDATATVLQLPIHFWRPSENLPPSHRCLFSNAGWNMFLFINLLISSMISVNDFINDFLISIHFK